MSSPATEAPATTPAENTTTTEAPVTDPAATESPVTDPAVTGGAVPDAAVAGGAVGGVPAGAAVDGGGARGAVDGDSAVPAKDVERKWPRLVALDGLRFVAALLTCSVHYIAGATGWWHQDTRQVFPIGLEYSASYGFFGVELFFLISGFVICMSSWGRSLGQFFVSRVSRLYPAYWAGVLITSFVLFNWHAVFKVPQISTVLVNLTMFSVPMGAPSIDVVYWTLWIELRFYLIFALVVWRGLTYRRAIGFCALWLVASVFAYSTGDRLLTTIFVPGYSQYFIAGIAMYLMYRFRPTMLLWAIVSVSYLMSLFAAVDRIHGSAKGGHHPNMPWWPGGLLITVFFLAVLAIANGWAGRIRGRWLTVLGQMTYPFYLMHQVIGLTIIYELSPKVPAVLLLPGTIVSMMLLAWLVHRFVERPLAPRLREGFRRGIEEAHQMSDPPERGQRAGAA